MSARRPWLAFVALFLCMFIFSMDVNILNVALARLVRDLGVSTSQLQWIVDSYIVVLAGLTVPGAGLGDRFGRKRVMLVGLVCFALSSAGGAFATTPQQLIAWRALMGVGAALVMPTSLAMIPSLFSDPGDRARAIGGWAAASGLALVVGPLIAGVLLRHFWWGSVFLVNVPIVLVVLVLAAWVVPDSRDPSVHKLDVAGALLAMASLSTLLWATIGAPDRGWASSTTIGAFLVGAALLGGFAVRELTASSPMIDLRLLQNRTTMGASSVLFFSFVAMTGVVFLVSQRAQLLLGYSPLDAALAMVPFGALYVVAAPSSARLVERFGPRVVLCLGVFGSAAASVLLASDSVDGGLWITVIGGAILGVTTGLIVAPGMALLMSSLSHERAGMASAVGNTSRLVGQAVGVAMMGSVLASGYHVRLSSGGRARGISASVVERARPSLGAALDIARRSGAELRQALREVARNAFAHGASASYLAAAVSLVLAGLVCARFVPRRAHFTVEEPVEDVEVAGAVSEPAVAPATP